ncbi:hypothetical protein ATANTOWER_031427 [Ataeniobius toweri]|uniref:Uncharacterized protein n=1 Tax=Ataeniobius toweri TaxID=208326 RepID=A0ABU7A0L7_9TELE|nr:hypothetical protein [Ataeniobius toweri]
MRVNLAQESSHLHLSQMFVLLLQQVFGSKLKLTTFKRGGSLFIGGLLGTEVYPPQKGASRQGNWNICEYRCETGIMLCAREREIITVGDFSFHIVDIVQKHIDCFMDH